MRRFPRKLRFSPGYWFPQPMLVLLEAWKQPEGLRVFSAVCLFPEHEVFRVYGFLKPEVFLNNLSFLYLPRFFPA